MIQVRLTQRLEILRRSIIFSQTTWEPGGVFKTELRPYQQEVGQAVTEKWNNGGQAHAFGLAHRLRKTIVFASTSLWDCGPGHGARVLILAHRVRNTGPGRGENKKICW